MSMKKIPLVIYEKGARKIIGDAWISSDGKVEAYVDGINLEGALAAGLVIQSSFLENNYEKSGK